MGSEWRDTGSSCLSIAAPLHDWLRHFIAGGGNRRRTAAARQSRGLRAMSLARSTTVMYPSLSMVAMSPVSNHPAASNPSEGPLGLLRYPPKTVLPRIHTVPTTPPPEAAVTTAPSSETSLTSTRPKGFPEVHTSRTCSATLRRLRAAGASMDMLIFPQLSVIP